MAKVNGFMIMGFTTVAGGITRDRVEALCGTKTVSFISANGRMTRTTESEFWLKVISTIGIERAP